MDALVGGACSRLSMADVPLSINVCLVIPCKSRPAAKESVWLFAETQRYVLLSFPLHFPMALVFSTHFNSATSHLISTKLVTDPSHHPRVR